MPDQGLDALALFSAVPGHLRALDARRPWLLDGTVALLAAAIMAMPPARDQFAAQNTGKPAALPWLLCVALAVPLLWRRRAPVRAFLAIAAVTAVQSAVGVSLPALAALLAGLYAVALYGSLTFLPLACGVGLAGMLLTVFRFMPGSVSTRLTFIAATTTAAVTLGLVLRIGHAYLHALEERTARLEIERDQRALLAAADERTRISREMHDVIGHHLAVIVGLADGGAALSRTVPVRGTQALTDIAGIGRQALTELRGLLGILQDGTGTAELAPQPTLGDLDPLFEHVRTAGLPVRFRASGRLDALPSGVQVVLYRIVQESLTNTLKHGGPGATASVSLTVKDELIQLEITDTGRARSGDPATEGRGLTGIRERAALYRGTAAAGPRPGGGWLVTASFPTREDPS